MSLEHRRIAVVNAAPKEAKIQQRIAFVPRNEA
jgi:hypothetical protein